MLFLIFKVLNKIFEFITDPLPLVEYAIDCYNSKSNECLTENGLRSSENFSNNFFF
jgi:hypothetical protein